MDSQYFVEQLRFVLIYTRYSVESVFKTGKGV